MSSPAQVEANQQNAALSTGPRTPEGKSVSSQNAVKFGLTSKQVLLPYEEPAEFGAMEAAILERWKPANNAERLEVDTIVVARWKIHRNELVQAAWSANELKKDSSGDRNLAMAAIALSPEIRRFQRYAAADRRVADNAEKKLAAMQQERRDREAREAQARHAARLVQEYRERMAAKLQNEPNPAPAPAPADTSAPSPRRGLLARLASS